jgi:hypothetical protein
MHRVHILSSTLRTMLKRTRDTRCSPLRVVVHTWSTPAVEGGTTRHWRTTARLGNEERVFYHTVSTSAGGAADEMRLQPVVVPPGIPPHAEVVVDRTVARAEVKSMARAAREVVFQETEPKAFSSA